MTASSPRPASPSWRGEPLSTVNESNAMRPAWFDAHLSTRDFERLRIVIERYAGIRMPDAKSTMLESRLRHRLRDLGIEDFGEYAALVLRSRPQDAEFVRFIDCVTTNKTDFFRERGHFDYLAQTTWPTLATELGAGLDRELVVWCAASSTGEEPYTLAMVLSEVAARTPGLRFRIIATDLSTEVLERAQRGVYTDAQVEPVPLHMRMKYLMRSKDRSQGLVRVTPALRSLVRFGRLNLVDDDWPVRERVDIIFCRNVFIYFDRKMQEAILRRFCRQLVPGGYVFLGHAEAINGHDVPLKSVGPTTYRTASTNNGVRA